MITTWDEMVAWTALDLLVSRIALESHVVEFPANLSDDHELLWFDHIHSRSDSDAEPADETSSLL